MDLNVVSRSNACLLSPSRLAISQYAWAFHTVLSVIDRWDHRFLTKPFELYMHGRISDFGIGTYPPRVQQDIGQEANVTAD